MTKIFCIPYAGGSANLFLKWVPYLSDNIELIPLELKARGSRFNECSYSNLEEAVSDIYTLLIKEVNEDPFSIYGHCMGAIIAYEVCKRIQVNQRKNPVKLFISGMQPPHLKENKKFLSMNDDDFMGELEKMEGIPKGFIENQELKDLFLPIIKNDFKLLEYYQQPYPPTRLNSPIVVINGKEDRSISFENIGKWKEYTHAGCDFYKLTGGHFFINENVEEVTVILNKQLS